MLALINNDQNENSDHKKMAFHTPQISRIFKSWVMLSAEEDVDQLNFHSLLVEAKNWYNLNGKDLGILRVLSTLFRRKSLGKTSLLLGSGSEEGRVR